MKETFICAFYIVSSVLLYSPANSAIPQQELDKSTRGIYAVADTIKAHPNFCWK
jgi:hypothetical protein